MNDYERLESKGWQLFYKGHRFDYYRKTSPKGHKWIAVVPITINYEIWYEKDEKRMKSNKQ